MDKKYGSITIHQLDLMKHALGLDQTKPKRCKYTAYRNYFCLYGQIVEWESLVELGVAASGDATHMGNESVFYFVSKEGIQLMENVLGFKIVEGVE